MIRDAKRELLNRYGMKLLEGRAAYTMHQGTVTMRVDGTDVAGFLKHLVPEGRRGSLLWVDHDLMHGEDSS